MAEVDQPILIFPYGFDERTAFEAEMKGVYDCAQVQLPTGRRVQVGFYDPVRLVQDLESAQECGDVCVAVPGMIVIPKVTLEYMRSAVTQLHGQAFFDTLSPLKDQG
jgi:hypothetical protein